MMNIRHRLTVIIIAVFISQIGDAQSRGFKQVEINVGDQSTDLYENSYSLLFGVSNFDSGWSDLPGVQKDISVVEEALKLHGYEVVKVEDPTKAELNRAFTSFIREYGQGERSGEVV